eukprot:jgi/Galph1/5087/GphlegSOOS_G3749.1
MDSIVRSDKQYFEDFASIWDIVTGHWKSSLLRVVVSFRLLDEIDRLSKEKGGSPVVAAEVAECCQTDPQITYRVLRAAETLSLVTEHHSPLHSFTLTRKGSLLLENQEGSARGLVLLENSREHSEAWLHLGKHLKTGKTVVPEVFGVDTYFEAFSHYASKHGEFLKTFQAGMASASEFDARSILFSYDFSKFHSICDIGAGPGVLLKMTLRKYPSIKGCISDLARVIEESVVIEDDLQGRCITEPCDFFKSVPGGYELYMMKHILHDWNDENSIRILRTIRDCAPQGSTLLLLEYVIPGPDFLSPGKLFDLHMGLLLNGKERTEDEWKKLFSATKWKYIGCHDTESRQISIIEAKKE